MKVYTTAPMEDPRDARRTFAQLEEIGRDPIPRESARQLLQRCIDDFEGLDRLLGLDDRPMHGVVDVLQRHRARNSCLSSHRPVVADLERSRQGAPVFISALQI